MNFEKADLDFKNIKFSFGLGRLISKIETTVIQFFLTLYRNLTKFFTIKYRLALNWIIINILNTKTLNYYSKIIILSSICLFLVKTVILLFKNNQPSQIEKCSFNNYLFFNNKVLKSKSALMDKESQIKFKSNEENWSKIAKFIEKNNRISLKNKAKPSSIKDPFFNFLKHYIDFETKVRRE